MTGAKVVTARRAGLLLVSVAIAAAAACASTGASARTERHRISETELLQVPERTTALEAVQRFRPQWLHGRGPSSVRRSEPVVVYLNRQRTGSDILRQLTVTGIRELRFLDAIAATQQFGTGHTSGAILITSR